MLDMPTLKQYFGIQQEDGEGSLIQKLLDICDFAHEIEENSRNTFHNKAGLL